MMDQEIKGILQRLEQGFGRLEEGQSEANKRIDLMDKRIDEGFKNVDERFNAVDERFDAVDKSFDAVDNRFDAVEGRLGNLEKGQDELKEMIKHSTTLLTENFTNIRQDLRRSKSETDSDINLLFGKTERHERDIAKIKQKLKL